MLLADKITPTTPPAEPYDDGESALSRAIDGERAVTPTLASFPHPAAQQPNLIVGRGEHPCKIV
jgi:hypothetical protein